MIKQQKTSSKTLQNLILNHKIKVEYISGNRCWCYCPLHEDNSRPNFCISLDPKYYGKCICWACGIKGTLSDGEMKLLDLEPLKEYNTHSKNYKVCWSKLIPSYMENLNRLPLLKEGLAHELNIKTHLLSDWLVGYDGQSFTIPMVEAGIYVGVQRRFPNGKKCCVTGSKLGIMENSAYGTYPDEPIFICEGFTDTVAVNDLGFTSIARPHCHFITGVTDYLNYGEEGYDECWTNIIIIPDNDTVGVEGANKLLDSIRGDTDYDCLSMFKFSGAKDIREYIAKEGKDKVRKELLRYC